MKYFILAISLMGLTACGSSSGGATTAPIQFASNGGEKVECGTDDWCVKLCQSRLNLYGPQKSEFQCSVPEAYPGECAHMEELYLSTLNVHMNIYYQCLASDKEETIDNITRWNNERDPSGAWKYHLFDPEVWIKK